MTQPTSGHDAVVFLPTDTTEEIRERGAVVAVLPVGSFEQHGPFLPMATDTLIANELAHRIAGSHAVLLLPPITFSCSHEHADWPGTVSISAVTLHHVVEDVARSLRNSGVHALALVNGHGGNYVLRNTVQESAARGTRMSLFPGPADWRSAGTAAGIVTSAHDDMHAGEIETSILLHTHPQLLRPGYASGDHCAGDRAHLLTLGMGAYTESGVIGRPSRATAAKGKALLESLTDSFGAHHALLSRGIGGDAR
ncbi:creatininase family protein [Streptomyces sp. NPDC058171]